MLAFLFTFYLLAACFVLSAGFDYSPLATTELGSTYSSQLTPSVLPGTASSVPHCTPPPLETHRSSEPAWIPPALIQQCFDWDDPDPSRRAEKMSLPSEERMIYRDLKQNCHDRWGWVIYRCTYDDDVAWAAFEQMIIDQHHDSIKRSDTPELLEALELTFIEDRGKLEDISRAELRLVFKEWAMEEFIKEQPRAADARCQWGLTSRGLERMEEFGFARYDYFIQVDKEALESVPAVEAQSFVNKGHVNLVNARWKPYKERFPEDEEDEWEEDYVAIDGCREYDVGWMKVASYLLDAWLYSSAEQGTEWWYIDYRRPPLTLDR